MRDEAREHEALEKRRAKEKLDAEQRKADIKSVLETPAGRRFIWGLIDVDANTFGGSFVAGHPDASAYNEGRRSIGYSLMTESLAAAPEAYEVMVRERAIAAANRQRELGVPTRAESKGT